MAMFDSSHERLHTLAVCAVPNALKRKRTQEGNENIVLLIFSLSLPFSHLCQLADAADTFAQTERTQINRFGGEYCAGLDE